MNSDMPVLCHPAGRPDVSDWNNALKLGFDPAAEAYPQWLSSQVPSRQHYCPNKGNDLSAIQAVQDMNLWQQPGRK
jgi:hypothetical protein